MKPGDIASETIGAIECRVSLGHDECHPHARLVEIATHHVLLNPKEGDVPIMRELVSERTLHTAYSHEIGVLDNLIRAKVAIDQAIANVLWADMKKKEPK